MDLIIAVDKPLGISSHSMTGKVKKAFRARKAGHAGTLDPAASGLLIVGINGATRTLDFFKDHDKQYVVTIKLGVLTDTLDMEGTVISEMSYDHVTVGQIEDTITGYEGEITQIPPMYSALKRDGVPLYKLARKGITVERQPRRVRVHSISVVDYVPPFLTLNVTCSKGTYIRTLACDISSALGTCGFVYELRRLRIGDFPVGDAMSGEDLLNGERVEQQKGIYTVDYALRCLADCTLDDNQLRLFLNGVPLPLDYGPQEGLLKRVMASNGKLIGIGLIADGKLTVKVLLVNSGEYLKQVFKNMC